MELKRILTNDEIVKFEKLIILVAVLSPIIIIAGMVIIAINR